MVGEGKPEHPLHPRRPFNRRQLLMQAVVAVVILVSGIGIGAGGTILALKNRLVPRLRLPPPSPPGMEPNVLVERWKGEYGLSDKQAQQAKDTLTKQFAATRELWQKFTQAEQSEREKFATAIKKILTPEQFTKWDEDLKKRLEHFRGMRPFDGRGAGRGGPRGERGPGRSMDPEGRRGNWPPRPPMDSDGHRRGDRPPDRPIELNSRPGEANAPK
ncbi:MAG: hypothetical protein NTZ17_00545 [Phycisphaerae bacterium]|nr:hypothetical protein [Phycisphaerae bacterium]